MEIEMFRRRHLPHWDVPGATYFVTSCLEGSIPAQGLLDIAKLHATLEQQVKPPAVTDSDWELEKWKRKFARVDHWLDAHPAKRILEDPKLAEIIVESFHRFANERYDLIAYVVMPSHFHWLFKPKEEWVKTIDPVERSPRERIMYSLKRFTANACNKILGVKGQFWQEESFDHWVRDPDELARIIRYIELNPVRAEVGHLTKVSFM